MRALIFADRQGAELEPLTEKWSVPLLPIAGKELLIYTIEELVAAGIRDLVIVTSAHGEQVSPTTLGDGQRWGANIRYVLSRGEEAPSALWQRISLSNGDALLAVRGDVMRSPVVDAFLKRAHNETGSSVFCGVEGDPRGSLILVRRGHQEPGELLDSLRWQDPNPLPTVGRCDIDPGNINSLSSFVDFHRANRDLISGRISGLDVGGRRVALGLQAGRRARISAKSLKKGVAYVGANSRVHSEAELLGEVVIGDDVVVDRAATVRDSVILPRSYVGELVEVGNAIVASNLLIRVDTGAILKISDAFLLGRLGAAEQRNRVSTWDRLAGLLLLILSLPLWPLAAIAASLSGVRPLVTSRQFVGNRSTPPIGEVAANGFVAKHWNTRVPVLRNLPRLATVVRGNLRLVGVSPLTPEEAASRTEEWQMVRDRAPVGLLGPTQLNLPQDAPLEERLLSDAFYARERGVGHDLGYVLQGLKMLFGRDAWRTPRRT